MNCIELSLKKLRKECNEWAKEIEKTYKPDVIIYIAKAGYIIAYEFNEIFSGTLYGISAVRKGNSIKEFVAPIFRKLPNKVRNLIIGAELKSDFHKDNSERKIQYLDDFDKKLNNEKKYNILIVDDSIDTGFSLKAVVDKIHEDFPNSNLKTAGLNVWDKSEKVIKTDYALYRNTIIKAPMSKDSREYMDFIQIYEDRNK